MRSLRRSTLSLLALTALALALFAAPAVRADPPLDVRSLSGTFHYTVISIRLEPEGPVTGTIYCNEYGRIAFDGAGGARVVEGSGYVVCSDSEGPVGVEPQAFTYTVAASGDVVLTEVEGDGYTTHCQLLQRGDLLLCDGTGGIPGVPNPELLLFQATAVKL